MQDINTTGLVPASSVSCQKLVDAFLQGRKPNTARAYAAGIEAFGAFLSIRGQRFDTAQAVAKELLSKSPGEANLMVMDYIAAMKDQGLSSATIATRIAAIKSLVQLAHLLGIVAWKLEVKAPKIEGYRDTTGPGKEGVKRMLEATADDTPMGTRNLALVRLMFDCGLRRSEVTAMNVEDLDAPNSRVRITGKGRNETEWITLPAKTMSVVLNWLCHRGVSPGPLFLNLDHLHAQGRLSGEGVRLIIRKLAHSAGLGRVRPHGLRHSAITNALDRGNDIRSVARFSRHKKLDTVIRYDDNRRDIAGDIARQNSEE